jgi:hypothetical protein
MERHGWREMERREGKEMERNGDGEVERDTNGESNRERWRGMLSVLFRNCNGRNTQGLFAQAQ